MSIPRPEDRSRLTDSTLVSPRKVGSGIGPGSQDDNGDGRQAKPYTWCYNPSGMPSDEVTVRE